MPFTPIPTTDTGKSKTEPWWFFGTPTSSSDTATESMIAKATLSGGKVRNRAFRIALPDPPPSSDGCDGKGEHFRIFCEGISEKMPSLREVFREYDLDGVLVRYALTSPQTHLQIEAYSDGAARLYFATLSSEDDEALLALNLHEMKKRDKAEVMMITRQGDQGLRTRAVQLPERPLIVENYASDTLDLWNKVRADLRAEVPNGRIAIFHGPPGTGKTHLIRGLIESSTDHIYLIVPSKEVSNIGDPEFTDLLLRLHDDYGGRRIVLVVEDADEILSRRQASAMSALANTLSIGDGLLGDAVNAFVVATTNATLHDIDAAMKRPGRLSALVEVPLLYEEQAMRALAKLAPDKTFNLPLNTRLTLAEIYQKARE
jgi:hypothetical protein